jgi:hypothetical protein
MQRRESDELIRRLDLVYLQQMREERKERLRELEKERQKRWNRELVQQLQKEEEERRMLARVVQRAMVAAELTRIEDDLNKRRRQAQHVENVRIFLETVNQVHQEEQQRIQEAKAENLRRQQGSSAWSCIVI